MFTADMSTAEFSLEIYQTYLADRGIDISPELNTQLQQIVQACNWDEPQSGLDCNNIAVIALIEAEYAEDDATRSLYFDTAREAFSKGMELDDFPLCKCHSALLDALSGELKKTVQMVVHRLLCFAHLAYVQDLSPPGLIYLPLCSSNPLSVTDQLLLNLLFMRSCYHQSIVLLTEVLNLAQPIFYNESGLRLLTLQHQISPGLVVNLFKLAISNLIQNRFEGIFYLHQIHQVLPNSPPVLQALFLAYKDIQLFNMSEAFSQQARHHVAQLPQSQQDPLISEFNPVAWLWTDLEVDSPYTYLQFDGITITVEASLRSIVTSVLLAQGDWFEYEMEFWRDRVQPGMTVIDVGANVGVYTFSAAKRVGATGRVLAVEPFSGCVQCLTESCRINQFDWVTVCAGAASDRNGQLKLALNRSSELNEVLTDESVTGDQPVETVASFTLDSLATQHGLDRLDLLKIDAEGHELQVLQGSTAILQQFCPIIIYENRSTENKDNQPVAEFLLQQGYELFWYKPFLKQLVPVDPSHGLSNQLNIIAMPRDRAP